MDPGITLKRPETRSKSFPLLVQNTNQTCYVSTLLASLFLFAQDKLRYLLHTYPKVPTRAPLLLQEAIKQLFVMKLSSGKSVLGQDLRRIFEICQLNGWDKPAKTQQDISEFFVFLWEVLGGEIIRFKISDFSAPSPPPEILRFLPVSFTPAEREKGVGNLAVLMHRWFLDNLRKQDTGEGEKQILRIYELSNLPLLLPIQINRFSEGKKDNTILKCPLELYPFRFSPKSLHMDLSWNFHALLCHRGETLLEGHYYCVIRQLDKWIIFDDLKIPSFHFYPKLPSKLAEEIQREGYFALYLRSGI